MSDVKHIRETIVMAKRARDEGRTESARALLRAIEEEFAGLPVDGSSNRDALASEIAALKRTIS